MNKIINEFIKFTRETLQETDGKYSSNKAMISHAFLLCAWAFVYQTLKTGIVNIDMFNTLTGVAFAGIVVGKGSNLLSKKIDTQTTTEQPLTTTTTNISIEKTEP